MISGHLVGCLICSRMFKDRTKYSLSVDNWVKLGDIIENETWSK